MSAENNKETVKKRAPGRPFEKGRSGNPGGRPKKDPAVTEILARGGPAAAQFMVGLLDDPKARAADKQRAAEYILDRLMGKAAQPIQADVFKAEQPLTLGEMLTMAREVVANAGSGGDEVP